MKWSCKRITSVFLVLALMIWCVPFAYADEADIEQSQIDHGVSDSGVEPVLSDDMPEDADQQINDDKWDSLNSLDSEEVLSGEDNKLAKNEMTNSGMSPSSVVNSTYMYQMDLQQQGTTTYVKVSFPNAASLIDSGRADRVVVEAIMSYNGVETRSISQERELASLVSSDYAFDIDMSTYGKFSVMAKFYKGDTLVKQGDTQTLGIIADEYNIAPVSASLPVTFFSLSLWGQDSIRYDADGNIIPTIMLTERPSAYNWSNLPEGVYGLPYLTQVAIEYQPSTFNGASDLFRQNAPAMADYVGDLYELNPSAKFNLYVVDYYVGLIQSILYANGIPENQYSITVLSDGSFSYQQFANVYNGNDPSSTHDELVARWNEAKEEAYTTGEVSDGYWMWQPNSSLYAAVASEPNAEWWLARPALLTTEGDEGQFGKQAQNDPKVVRVYIDRMLRNLQEEGDGAVSEFKALYNFSDTYFSSAREAGKQIMMFLGTTVPNEAGSFGDYARFAMAYYGDDYVYYYKGHPATPTDLYPEKQTELDALGITDVDSSIAAELILFFNPDIYMSGYASSTYASVSDPRMAKGLFRTTKASALSSTTSDYSIMDYFISPISNDTDQEIKDICKEGDNNYLVEFSESMYPEIDYTIAIWDSSTSTISYYLLKNGQYTFVRSTQSGGNLVDGGAYLIKSKSSAGKVVDIDGASDANGGNVQIWSNNESPAQTFRLAHAGDGYYTIQNVNSGKMLDVSGASNDPGANVWQYDVNGTDAQKWRMVDTGDGDDSYFLVSKCNNLNLDIQWNGSTDGTNIQVYSGNGSEAQKFYLDKAPQPLADGMYTIQSKLADDKVLDISGGSSFDAANVQLYESNSTQAQQFEISFDASSGYYSIANAKSGKALDVKNGWSFAGANVWQYGKNRTSAQKWRIESAGDGSYCIFSATGNGCCLDVSGADIQNGANVQIYSPNGTNAQKWIFTTI